MNSIMEIREILRYLPHRFPFLLIDRVVSIDTGKSIVALKNVTVNEPFFVGHFPHHPVMPGVLIVEALAQAAAILSFKTMDRLPDPNSIYYFAGIDRARFKRPVVPGDQLELKVQITRGMRGIWKFSGVAYVGETVATEADLMCTLREVPPPVGRP
jgi:3-hydroxyacyl-[acyl-carrier-protein] dehydratase